MVTHGSATGGCSMCRGANAGEGLPFYSLAAKIVCCVYLALLWLAAPSTGRLDMQTQ